MMDNIDEMAKMWETLIFVKKYCLKCSDCDECIFQGTICGQSVPAFWNLDLLKKRIEKRC